MNPGISDHDCVNFQMALRLKQPRKRVYAYSKAYQTNLLPDLRQVVWPHYKQFYNIDDYWEAWKDKIFSVLDDNVPSRIVPRKQRLPWIDSSIRRMLRKQNQLHKRYKHAKSDDAKSAYLLFRKHVNKALRKAERDYVKNMCETLKNNSKPFWNFVRLKRMKNNGINTLKDNGKTLTNDSDMANALSTYFKSVFCKDNSILPQVSTEPSKMGNFRIKSDEVLKELKKLNPNKALGPDNISPKMLKLAASELAYPLSVVFNVSLETVELPSDWKPSNIVPLFKKGSKTNPRNYRPVSLTSVVCKYLERILNRKLLFYLISDNIIINNQHGFRPGRSCETQLLDTVNDWSEALDRGMSVDVAFLDISRAFDSVSHPKLMHKLSACGISCNSHLWKWIQSFLIGRKQRVCVNGSFSDWEDVALGVPQGTILGPTLFLIYINDMSTFLYGTTSIDLEVLMTINFVINTPMLNFVHIIF